MSLNKIVPSMGDIVLVLSSNRHVKRVNAEEKMQFVVAFMAAILDLNNETWNFAIDHIFIVFLDHQHVGLVIKIMDVLVLFLAAKKHVISCVFLVRHLGFT